MTTPRCPTCGSRYYDQFVWWTFPVGEVRKASCIPGAFDPWHTESLEVGGQRVRGSSTAEQPDTIRQAEGSTPFPGTAGRATPTSENLATVREALSGFDESWNDVHAALDALEQELAWAVDKTWGITQMLLGVEAERDAAQAELARVKSAIRRHYARSSHDKTDDGLHDLAADDVRALADGEGTE